MNIFKKDKAFVLQVKDEGKGMPYEIQNRLFTRFASFNTDKSKPSTGIGLSIVKEIADKHHAKVTVESHVDKGSVFTVWFQPGLTHFFDDQNVEIMDAGDSEEKVDFMDSDTEEKLSILVVEDDSDLRNFIKSILSPYYNLYDAANGVEGYEKAIRFLPDFILSDRMMPQMDGMELLQEIRKNKDISHIPFILLTAKTGIESELEGIASGADDYITKPFNVKLLKAKIHTILTQRKLFSERFTNLMDRVKSVMDEDAPSHNITRYDEEFLKKVIDLIEANMDNRELVFDNLVAG
ncbi:MAG: response regulator, partial [Clostridium sp.]|nr:response regulator [Clostridium sp.]